MTSSIGTNSLSTMMGNAFIRLDLDKDGKLNGAEFKSFYEVLKPGIALDEDKKPVVGERESMERMDTNSDGSVSREEAHGAQILMPAELTDGSLQSMLKYLLEQSSLSAQAAALALSRTDNLESPPMNGPQ